MLCSVLSVYGGSTQGLATANTTCGTCESFGYQCVGTSAPLDSCGQPISAASCAVPSCATYCLVMSGLSGGYCNDNTHQCLCDPDSVSTGSNPPPPPAQVIIQASPDPAPEPAEPEPESTPTPALIPKAFSFGTGAISGTVVQATFAMATIVALGVVGASKMSN